MALPFIPLAVLAAKGLAGIGTGAAATKAFGGDYDKSNAIVDFGIGAVAFPGAGRIKDASKVAPKFIPGKVRITPSGKMFPTEVAVGRFGRPIFYGPTSRPSRFSGPLNALAYNAGGGTARTARFVGQTMLPFGGGGLESYLGLSPSQPLSPQPSNVTQLTPMTSDAQRSTGSTYSPSPAPATFNKTLQDYLDDPNLQRIVRQNINLMNMPLFSANKATRKRMANEIAQNNYIARTLQADYNKRIADQQAEMKLMQDRDNARQQAMLERSAIAESDVPLTYVSGEAATAKRETTEAAANEQAMSDALVDRLAGSANEYLKELQLAQRSESSAQEQGIRQQADEEIANAMAQIRANQAQYGTLLADYGARQYAADIDAYNANINAYNAEQNRIAESVKAATEALESTPEYKQAKKVADRLNSQINILEKERIKINTKFIIDEDTGKNVLESSTKKGKKRLQAITNEIMRLNNELAALGAI